jgi:catechol 2,3-dioxygenase-like lactoylglutathione lyase family enzyme
MAVRRIVTNIAADNLERANPFYVGILGLRMVMDHDWIVTLAADTSRAANQHCDGRRLRNTGA